MVNVVAIMENINYWNLVSKTPQPFDAKMAKELSRVVFHSIA